MVAEVRSIRERGMPHIVEPQNDGERIAALAATVEAHNANDLRDFARLDQMVSDLRVDMNALAEKISDIQKSVWQASGMMSAFSFVGSIVIALAIKHFA